MFDQTQMKQLIQAAEQAWYACAHQTCSIRGCPNEQNIAHQTHEQKKCFTFLIECLMAFKFYQTRSNKINQHQTRCPNGKMFGYQTFIVCPGPNNESRGTRKSFIMFTTVKTITKVKLKHSDIFEI